MPSNDGSLSYEEMFGSPAQNTNKALTYEEMFGTDAPSRTAADYITDVGVTALKGAVGLPQAIVGVADIPTGGHVGKALEGIGYRPNETQKTLDTWYSPAQQEANRKVHTADGFVDTMQAAIENPSAIATTIGESIPQMIGGAGIARGLMKGGQAVGKAVAPWMAGAAGEGVIGAGSAEESIRGQTPDGLTTPTQSLAAGLSGVGTAALGALGGKLSQRIGLADIDTMLAQGGANAATAAAVKAGFFKQVVGIGISEGTFEELPQSVQEQMWQNYALGKPLNDRIGNAGAFGWLAGTATGGAGGGYNAMVGKITPAQPPQDTAQPDKNIAAAKDIGEAIAATEASVAPRSATDIAQSINDEELLNQLNNRPDDQAYVPQPETEPRQTIDIAPDVQPLVENVEPLVSGQAQPVIEQSQSTDLNVNPVQAGQESQPTEEQNDTGRIADIAAPQGETDRLAPEAVGSAGIDQGRVGTQLTVDVKSKTFDEIGRLSADAQKLVDARHDELDAQGVSWDDQKNDAKLNNLYEKRIAFDTAAAQKAYAGAKEIIGRHTDGLPFDKFMHGDAETILRRDYGLDNGFTGAYNLSKIGEALANPKTVEKAAKTISVAIFQQSHPNADYDMSMTSNMSGLSAKEKSRILKEGLAKANEIHDDIRKFLMSGSTLQPTVNIDLTSTTAATPASTLPSKPTSPPAPLPASAPQGDVQTSQPVDDALRPIRAEILKFKGEGKTATGSKVFYDATERLKAIAEDTLGTSLKAQELWFNTKRKLLTKNGDAEAAALFEQVAAHLKERISTANNPAPVKINNAVSQTASDAVKKTAEVVSSKGIKPQRTSSIEQMKDGGWRVKKYEDGLLKNTIDYDVRGKAESERVLWERGLKYEPIPLNTEFSDIDKAATAGYKAGLNGGSNQPNFGFNSDEESHAFNIGMRRGLEDSKSKPTPKPKPKRKVGTPKRMSMLQFVASIGGLNRAEAAAEFGRIDDMKRHKSGIFGSPAFRVNGGLAWDRIGEALAEAGYLPKNEHGQYDKLDLEERLNAELDGEMQYTFDDVESMAENDKAARELDELRTEAESIGVDWKQYKTADDLYIAIDAKKFDLNEAEERALERVFEDDSAATDFDFGAPVSAAETEAWLNGVDNEQGNQEGINGTPAGEQGEGNQRGAERGSANGETQQQAPTGEFALTSQTEEGLRQQEVRAADMSIADREAADRASEVPLTLSPQSSSNTGSAANQGSMFTPDGRASKAAEAKPQPESKPTESNQLDESMRSWELDFGMMGKYTYRASNQVKLKDGETLVASTIYKRELTIPARVMRDYGLGNNPSKEFAFRVSVIANKDGETFAQVERMTSDNRQGGNEVVAHFEVIKTDLLENRALDPVNNFARKFWEQYGRNYGKQEDLISKPTDPISQMAASVESLAKSVQALVENQGKLTENTTKFVRRGDFWNYSGNRVAEIAKVLDLTVTSRDGIKSVGIPDYARDNMERQLRDAGINAEFEADVYKKSENVYTSKERVKWIDISKNKVFTDDAAAAARAILKKKLGQLNSGLDPEMMQAGITLAGHHIEKGARTFAAFARAMIDDLGDAVKPYLKSWYAAIKFDQRAAEFSSSMDSMSEIDAADVDALTGENNVTDEYSGTDLERDSENADPEDSLGEESVFNERGANVESGKPGVSGTQKDDGAGSSLGLSGREAAPDGERGNLAIYTGATGRGAEDGIAGDSLNQRSNNAGIEGPPIESDAASVTQAAATSGSQLNADKLKQKVADRKEHTRTLENIRLTLPILTEGQQEDVFKAETRFAKEDGYGMLFTNGTGTGKTFTGLGVIKRFFTEGKRNIIIAVPNDKIAGDWQKSGTLLGLDISRLENTNSAGEGVVITTYANYGQNNQLAHRNWDLIVHDEAHYLAMDKDGTNTLALHALRALSLHPNGASTRHSMLYADDIAKLTDLQAKLKDDDKNANLKAELDKAMARHKETREKVKNEIADNQGSKRPRALFLSATPFAYVKTVDWANGYLFDYDEGRSSDTSRSYNTGSNANQFFMQHFGYSMRYNKLTQPDAKVDTGLMQRQFNSYLKKNGTLSGRMLDVKADYDRRFVLVDSAIGTQIDAALQWFEEERKANKGNEDKLLAISKVGEVITEKFDYLSRRYLLESIKAKEVLPHVREHLALGRKVVVFHDYKKGGGFNPFDLSHRNSDDSAAYNEVVDSFRSKFKSLIQSDVWHSSSPITTFQREFPNVLLFNGEISPKQRRANVEKFQDDASGPQVFLVQSQAGKEGISLHDTTGKHQRVLFNLGQPTQPTTAIQQEGRIYRTGQVTDAIFRYLNTGTNWEKWAFATTASRSSAAENLGMGEHARALKDAFIEAFEESDSNRAGMEGEGKGGKERDQAANNALTEYDRARAFYFGTQKKNSRTKSQEGTDYFATPEPVGLTMVQLADIRIGESVLEPSAGHGAIARWMPENAERTAVEPSMSLRPRLAMVFDGKIVDSTFEDLHVVNKYDAIIMNPPFGSGGRMAIDHLAKAATHLRDGGRIVALIPTGPAADAKFDKWFYETVEKPVKPLATHPTLGPIYKGDTISSRLAGADNVIAVSAEHDGIMFSLQGSSFSTLTSMQGIYDVKPTGKRTTSYRPTDGLNLVSDIMLPQVTFERAGTAVSTRIVVIEKSRDTKQFVAQDYSGITDINDLFDRMENISIPPRAKAQTDVQPATPQKASKPVVDKVAAKETADAAGLEIIEHTTSKGKVIRGVVRTDLTPAEAKDIDKFTFKKNGGWFIREKHLAPDNGLMAKSDDQGYTVSEQSNGNPYENLETRPNTTEAQLDTGREALAAAESRIFGNVRSGLRDAVSLLGSSISSGFREKGGVSLLGQKIESPADLAILAQVMRDPRFETFRIFYTDEAGKIVGEAAYSSRLPGAVYIPGATIDKIASDKKRFGASGYWMLHNHPSGSSAASKADLNLTEQAAKVAPGFLGHVIIDHDEYSHISVKTQQATSKVVPAPWMGSYNMKSNPEKPHALLGRPISGPRDLASIAKDLQKKDGFVVIFGVDAQNRVSFLTEIPASALATTGKKIDRLRIASMVRRATRETGVIRLFAGVPGKLSDFYHLTDSKLFADVVELDTGKSARDTGEMLEGDIPVTKSDKQGSKGGVLQQNITGYTGGKNPISEAKRLRDRINYADERATRDPSEPVIRTGPSPASIGPKQPKPVNMPQQPEDAGRALGFWMRVFTRNQIVSMYQNTIIGKQLKEYKRLREQITADTNQLFEEADNFLGDLRLMPVKLRTAFADLAHQSTLHGVDPANAKYVPSEDAVKLDAYIARNPSNKKLAAEAKASLDEMEAAHKRLRAMYLALPDTQFKPGVTARSLFDGLRQRYVDQTTLMFQAFEGRVNRMDIDENIKESTIKELKAQLKTLLDRVYFPLYRSGDFILRASKAGEQDIIEHHESERERNKHAKLLRAAGYVVDTSKRVVNSKNQKAVVASGAIKKLIENATANGTLAGEELKNLLDEIDQTIIKSMPDTAYRRAFIHRKGTAGYSDDFIRAYASSMRRSSSHIANLRHGDKIPTAIEDMRKAIKTAPRGSNTDALDDVVNRVVQIEEDILIPTGKFATAAGRIGFAQMLGSLSNFILNATQTYMITLPHLGGEYGYTKTMLNLAKANADQIKAMKKPNSLLELGHAIDMRSRLSGNELELFKQLHDSGKLDLGQVFDLIEAASNASENISDWKLSLMKFIGLPQHISEVINRQVTALAAIRLELARSGSTEKAYEAAKKAIDETHFDYSKENRAKVMSGDTARVVLMFKQYAQNYMFTWGNTAKLALIGSKTRDSDGNLLDGNRPSERKKARKQLAGLMGTQFLAAGALGLPIFAQSAVVASGMVGFKAGGEKGAFVGVAAAMLIAMAAAFGDEDDGKDFDTEMRLWFAKMFGPTWGEVLAKGIIPLGMSSRLDASQIIFRTPETTHDKQKYLIDWAKATAGAFWGGTVANDLQGTFEIMNGNPGDGAKKFIPVKQLKDFASAWQWAHDDMTVKNKDGEIVSQVSKADVFWKAVGVNPSSVVRAQEFNHAKAMLNEALIDKRKKVLIRMIREDNDKIKFKELMEYNKQAPLGYHIEANEVSGRLKREFMNKGKPSDVSESPIRESHLNKELEELRP